MSHSKRCNTQELGKDTAPQGSLKLKKDHELVGVLRKRDPQKLTDEQALTGPLPSENERLNPKRAAFTNRTETQMKPAHTSTDGLHCTDELGHTGELSEPRDAFHARLASLHEQDLISDEKLQTSEKLISKSDAQAKSPKQFIEDLENDPTYSKEFKKNIKILQFFAQEANVYQVDEEFL